MIFVNKTVLVEMEWNVLKVKCINLKWRRAVPLTTLWTIYTLTLVYSDDNHDPTETVTTFLEYHRNVWTLLE